MIRVAIAALVALACAHLAALGWWFVEDAAISFAYARNWADGWGLVAYPGGERVEGYSNFLWVVLLALGELVGAGAFWTAKLLALALVAGTVPLVAHLGRRAAGPAGGLLAAAVFALDAQVAIFGASGLENPLFSFLLALGLLLALREAETGGRPWSALAFLGLALCRPEGVTYAAAGGAFALADAVRRRAPLRVLEWLALFFGPFVAYHLVRYDYFGWPFPMTYYAKVHEDPARLLDVGARGWRYVAGWAVDLWRMPFVPLLLLGRFGLARWRWAAAALVVGAALVAWPHALGWVGLGLLVAVPTDLGPRSRAAVMALLSVAFAVYAQGDWMGGYRWLSFAAVPLAVLLGAGIADLAAALPRLGVPAGALALLAFAATNVGYTRAFARDPEISPHMIRGRVTLVRERALQLHLDERPRVLTVDLGAFMWWSGMELVDAVGLVDVTFARHAERPYAVYDEYVFDERRPHFLWVGAREGERIRRLPSLSRHYATLLGGRAFVRRDLLVEPRWSGTPGRAVRLERAVTLEGVDVPAAESHGALLVELGLRDRDAVPFDARVLLRDAAGRVVASWPVAFAYGWTGPAELRADEVFHGRYTLALPPALPEGVYALGVRFSIDGAPVEVVEVPTSAQLDDATVWFPGLVQVVGRDVALAAAERDLRRARGLAAEARCEEAQRAWQIARAHLPADRAFADHERPAIERRLAACWMARAEADPEQAVQAVERARALDPRAPDELAARLAEQRWGQGLLERRLGHWKKAYHLFTDAVRLDPTRTDARREAEEMRAVRFEGRP